MENSKYKCCIQCFTYNQADYIEDTLNGFCIQETPFPFVCIVVDDASTDGEQGVITNYLQNHFKMSDADVVRREETDDYRLVFAQHSENKNCFFVSLFLKYNHYQIKKAKMPYVKEWIDAAEYRASCEGDDYWICPTKLQKQVDFLDTHPNYSAVFANMVFRNEKVLPIQESIIRYDKDTYTLKDVYKGQLFPINSVCIRNEVYKRLSEIRMVEANGDFKLSYTAAKYGLVQRIDETLTVYRKTGKGLSSQWNPADQLKHDINEWYAFHKQLGFPDRTSLAINQGRMLSNYMLSHGIIEIPYQEIKDSLFPSKWYIYLGVAVSTVFKRMFSKIGRLIKRTTNGK